MPLKLGINGFGRIGRLALRVLQSWDDIEVIRINDPAGDAKTLAHLYNFDSVHGRSRHEAVGAASETIELRHQKIQCTRNTRIDETDWSGCDLVIEASGKMKSQAVLNDYLEQGVKRVVVAAPVNVLADLQAAEPSTRRALLDTLLADQVFRVLALPAGQKVDPHESLLNLGMDSLMAMELRNRIQAAVGVRVVVADLIGGASLTELVKIVMDQLVFNDAKDSTQPNDAVEWEEGQL